jgi:RNA polymerase sigma-70 factor (ECF subfamily)
MFDGISGRLAPSDFTEAELRDRMIRMDALAWREFRRRYDRLIRRCVYKVLGRFPSLATPDDVHEVEAQLLFALTTRNMHKLRAFEPERGQAFGSWIGMLATHAAWDFVRAASRRRGRWAEAEVERTPSSRPSPFDELAASEHRALVAAAVRDLSPRDRLFVQLYFLADHTPEEIASAMGISIKTVYTKRHKIQARLERALARS